ncbi:MAG: TolC family protein, partial [Spirochaeta sp.]
PNTAPEATDAPVPLPDPPRWNLSTGISARLTLSAQMIHGIRAVTNAYENQQMQLEDARRSIEMQVRKSFYSILLQQESLALSEQRLQAAQERLNEVRQNYQAGLVDELTLRQTQVAVENQRPAILRQQQGLETAKRNLASTIGIQSLQGVSIAGSIDTETLRLRDSEALLQFIDENADVRTARQNIRGLQTQIDATRAGMLPTISFSLSANPVLSGDPWSSDVFDTENWNEQGGSFRITLTQPLDPLLPGSGTRLDIANQRDRLRQTELQVEQNRQGTELQTMQITAAITATEETIASLQSNVALAERAFELAEEAYESGLREYSVVRDAEIDLADARLQLLQEQHQYIDLLLDLENLLNTPIENLQEN